ncbi:MAG: SAM-dependent chlorinase/fluorinase [Phycisphaerales bacterium]|nr:MAG: SAM-dependent chlorinase/fluorinase [Phycisphaerales bacterium]
MIVLLTDFGPSEYVGVMKGVIYSVHTAAATVDLCHDVGPQSIVEGAWILKNSYRHFPKGAVFCCVVDPGVGTERKALAVKSEEYYFVAPDNGLLWETVKEGKAIDARQIPVPEGASRTFHGRDVFAVAAANIDKGGFDRLTEKVDRIERLEFHREGREGMVVRIDRFGNIITNLPGLDKGRYSVQAAGAEYSMKYCETYDAAEAAELFLIEGSCGTLEISIRNGSASDRLQLRPGMTLTIV